MSMAKKIIVTVILVAYTLFGLAQDIYFSQFYAAPLLMNPALTGFYPGDMQVGLNYRNSTNGFIPASTYAASADIKIAKRVIKPNIFALGLVSAIDNVSKGLVSSTNLLASGAYHICMDKRKFHYLSFGAQIGMLERQFNPDDFTYDVQWDHNTGFHADWPTHENFQIQQAYNFDWNMGFFWYSHLPRYSALFIGSSVFHLHEPKQSFLGKDEHFTRRILIHGGNRIGFNQEFSLIPQFMVMLQNRSQQIIEGLTMEYRIRDTETAFRFGSWFRHSDNSIIFSAGFRASGVQFGLSSDFISPIQKESRTRGAMEFSVVVSPTFTRQSKLSADPTRIF
mgnify:CR=1 FL=1